MKPSPRHLLYALHSLNLPSAVMGGVAVATWNHFRATADVDVLLGIGGQEAGEIIAHLGQFGFRPKQDAPVLTIEGNRIIQLVYQPPEAFLDIQLDLMLADSPFQQSVLSRRITLRLPAVDQEVGVVACEDLIILKLLAGRMIDRADAAALIRINRNEIDLEHLLEWVRRLGLGDDSEEILHEAFPTSRFREHTASAEG